jgi:hypothetical protein
MKFPSSRHSIREFVDSLDPGSRVVWIANGAMGTIREDKSIMWDDGHHMTRQQMNDNHVLLIHSETERARFQKVLASRANCLKRGCTLVQWDDARCKEGLPERLCPLAVISEPEFHPIIDRSRKRRLKSARAQAS